MRIPVLVELPSQSVSHASRSLVVHPSIVPAVVWIGSLRWRGVAIRVLSLGRNSRVPASLLSSSGAQSSLIIDTAPLDQTIIAQFDILDPFHNIRSISKNGTGTRGSGQGGLEMATE